VSPFFKKLFRPRIVVKKLVRVAYDAYWDWRYGGWCGGSKDSPYERLGVNSTQSTEYLQLRILFGSTRVPITDDDVLVDVGCGRGRVINYWLMSGHRNRMVGIEIDEEITRFARHRLRKHSNVTILAGDAIALLPADATKFYLWNPFRTEMARRFKGRLMEVYGRRGNVTIIYYNCEAIRAFEGDPDWLIERLESEPGLAFPSAIIRMKEPVRADECSSAE
jgi:SAM-dependent methyltransferase